MKCRKFLLHSDFLTIIFCLSFRMSNAHLCAWKNIYSVHSSQMLFLLAGRSDLASSFTRTMRWFPQYIQGCNILRKNFERRWKIGQCSCDNRSCVYNFVWGKVMIGFSLSKVETVNFTWTKKLYLANLNDVILQDVRRTKILFRQPSMLF